MFASFSNISSSLPNATDYILQVYALAKVLKEGLMLDITNYPIALVQRKPDFPFVRHVSLSSAR